MRRRPTIEWLESIAEMSARGVDAKEGGSGEGQNHVPKGCRDVNHEAVAGLQLSDAYRFLEELLRLPGGPPGSNCSGAGFQNVHMRQSDLGVSI